MAAVRGKDTGPELVVRRVLSAMGYRYRLHRRDLPGNPDIVFVARRAVVFVHGCFWHRHACRFGRATPRARADFWKAKFDGNVARDRRVRAKLRRLGWRVLVVWECSIGDVDGLTKRFRRFLGPVRPTGSARRASAR
jgi:DNA mismatch endonuclease (patch repair protein)